MELVTEMEKLKLEVNKIIEKYLPRKINKKWLEEIFGKPRYRYNLDSAQKSLIDPIWDFLDRGGKRWRPVLFLLVYNALRGEDTENVKDLVIIPELIHNGTIIIDDIEDKGELRRGKPCLHHIFGEDIAVNAGNFLYFFPLIAVIKNKYLESKIKEKVYEIFAQEMINLSLGQGTDIYWHKGKAKDISEQEYLQMCAYKTGCLSRMSAKIAAVLAGADDSVVDKVGEIAESIGIGFQIQDDILDITLTDRKSFGKSFGNDIKEGKRSLIVIYTLSKASEEDKRKLIEILDKEKNTDDEIIEAIKLMEKYGAIDYARKRASEIIRESWKKVDFLLKENESKKLLKEFVYYLIERKV